MCNPTIFDAGVYPSYQKVAVSFNSAPHVQLRWQNTNAMRVADATGVCSTRLCPDIS